jgi:hypothetical protein
MIVQQYRYCTVGTVQYCTVCAAAASTVLCFNFRCNSEQHYPLALYCCYCTVHYIQYRVCCVAAAAPAASTMSDGNCEWNFFLPLFCRKLWGRFITTNGNCYVKINRTVHNIKNLSPLELFESVLIYVNRHMDEKLWCRRR